MAVSRVKPVPSPVGGWNASDSLDDMPEADAIKLENWYPLTESVITRKGYESFCSGLGSNVETLAQYRSATATQLIACADDEIFNITSGTAVSLGTGYTNARWQTVNKNGLLIMVNGADTPISWDGSSIANLSITSAGLTSSNLIDVTTYRGRIWYVEKDTANVYYSAVDAVDGACTKFPLANLGISGGYLIAVDTWTRDAGDGADDLIVFIMSTGEIFVYQGDPASTFSLIGKFTTSEPLSIRCTLKYGANLWLITRAGVVSLEAVMALGEQAMDRGVTQKIKSAFRQAADTWGVRFGWEAVYYPKMEMILFNIPAGVDIYHQYVVNALTGSWCSFTGMSAFTWTVFDGNLYFGGNGEVFKADTGFDDNGSNIVSDAITSFNYLGSKGEKKQVTMAQVSLKLNGNLQDNITIANDFQLPAEPSAININQVGGTPWGSPWGSPWSGQAEVEDNFVAVSAWGYNVAMRLKIGTSSQQTNWYSTRWVFKSGGIV